MTDPFEAYGAEKGKRDKPVRITGKEAPMVLKGLEKKQDEDAKQAKRYRAAQRAELQGMLNGPRGNDILDLQRLLREYVHGTTNDAWVMAFLNRVEWFSNETITYRLRVLSMIGTAILRSRIRDGRPPFDDPIPLLDSVERPAPEGLFQTAKERLSDADHEPSHQDDAERQPENLGARPDKIGR